MTVVGGRGTLETVKLQHTALAIDQTLAELHGRAPYEAVVATLIGCIALAVDVTVEKKHRDTRLKHLADHGSEGIGLVWRGDNYIKAIFGKVTDILDLLFVAVVGRSDLDHGIVVENQLAVDLLVHLRAPVIVAALRHANTVDLAVASAGAKKGGQGDGKNQNSKQREMNSDRWESHGSDLESDDW